MTNFQLRQKSPKYTHRHLRHIHVITENLNKMHQNPIDKLQGDHGDHGRLERERGGSVQEVQLGEWAAGARVHLPDRPRQRGPAAGAVDGVRQRRQVLSRGDDRGRERARAQVHSGAEQADGAARLARDHVEQCLHRPHGQGAEDRGGKARLQDQGQLVGQGNHRIII